MSSFAEISDSLLDRVEHEAALSKLAEPFIAGLPGRFPGTEWAWTRMRRDARLLDEGQKLLALMAPREALHRALIAAL